MCSSRRNWTDLPTVLRPRKCVYRRVVAAVFDTLHIFYMAQMRADSTHMKLLIEGADSSRHSVTMEVIPPRQPLQTTSEVPNMYFLHPKGVKRLSEVMMHYASSGPASEQVKKKHAVDDRRALKVPCLAQSFCSATSSASESS